MWKTALVIVVTSGLLVFGTPGNPVCDGIFKVDNIEKCDNPEKYSFSFEFQKRKIDRTTDGFNVTVKIPQVVTQEDAVRLESFVKCDGGYKASDITGPISACELVNTYLKDNFEKALTMAGVDPPNCPIPEGTLVVNGFVVDYETLPKRAKCGEYKTHAYLLKNGMEVGCVTAYTTFLPQDDDDDEDDD